MDRWPLLLNSMWPVRPSNSTYPTQRQQHFQRGLFSQCGPACNTRSTVHTLIKHKNTKGSPVSNLIYLIRSDLKNLFSLNVSKRFVHPDRQRTALVTGSAVSQRDKLVCVMEVERGLVGRQGKYVSGRKSGDKHKSPSERCTARRTSE